MRILIAAGGTGGHIYPALAVVRSLLERSGDIEARWVGGHRGLESSLVPPAGFELDRLWLRSLRSVDFSVATVLDPVRLGLSFSQAFGLLASWQPRAVFTTGGYVAIPILGAAAALRIPTLLWEGNLVPGRSVRATARLASAIAVSFGATCERLPDPCYETGTPIRTLDLETRPAARGRLGIPLEERVVLVFGGSQEVRRFNEAVASSLVELVSSFTVLHVTGEPAYAEALRRRETLPPESRSRYRPFPFLRTEMADALVSADLVVGRAGSSTLAELTALGVPAVIVPYPHASAHQGANAARMHAAGAVEVVADEEFDGAALLRAARELEEPARRAVMSAASRALGRPGAARANTELLLALAERRALPRPEKIERIAREFVA